MARLSATSLFEVRNHSDKRERSYTDSARRNISDMWVRLSSLQRLYLICIDSKTPIWRKDNESLAVVLTFKNNELRAAFWMCPNHIFKSTQTKWRFNERMSSGFFFARSHKCISFAAYKYNPMIFIKCKFKGFCDLQRK